jgi:hypothetical protein
MRTLLNIVGGLAVLVLSFWATLKVIDNWPQPAPSEFDIAMAAEGFSMSDAIVGSVDVIQRDAMGRLQLAGWAFDKELAQPVSVLVLVGAKFEPVAVTKGARPDVTLTLKQSAEQTKNVVFTGLTGRPVDCGPFTIVAVNQNKRLSVLALDIMAPRCTS